MQKDLAKIEGKNIDIVLEKKTDVIPEKIWCANPY